MGWEGVDGVGLPESRKGNPPTIIWGQEHFFSGDFEGTCQMWLQLMLRMVGASFCFGFAVAFCFACAWKLIGGWLLVVERGCLHHMSNPFGVRIAFDETGGRKVPSLGEGDRGFSLRFTPA